MKKLNILLHPDYFERFYQLKKDRTNREAYEILEKELNDMYGIYKYSSFESFKVGLYRYVNFTFRQIE